MLLAVNIGNSSIRFGVFDHNDCIISWVINTKPYKTEDELFMIFKNMYEQYDIEFNKINKIVIGSVVPHMTINTKRALKKIHHVKPQVVDRNTPSTVKHYSQQMGTDLYANAVAAHYLYKGKKIIIDFGTALTFTCIDETGSLKGVIIAPGIHTSLKALIGDTAQLPDIELKAPNTTLGLDTETCMQSGMVYGFLSMVEGLIDRINDEIGEQALVIATGGLVHIYAPLTNKININDRLHTLKGLKFLYQE